MFNQGIHMSTTTEDPNGLYIGIVSVVLTPFKVSEVGAKKKKTINMEDYKNIKQKEHL